MSTIFRFAIQTEKRRYSDIWTFICNKNHQCLYAKRISQKQGMKVSFHKTGDCHVKSYEEGDEIGTQDHKWRYEDAGDGQPIHIMRIVYDLRRQQGDFEFTHKVGFAFEDLAFPHSIYLDVFFIHSDHGVELSDETGAVACHHMGGGKWVYFAIDVGPLVHDLPDGIAEMSIQLGDPISDAEYPADALKNLTAVCYQVPVPSGTFVAYEASAAHFSLIP